MGESDSTTNVGNSRLRICNAYQKNNSEPFVEDMNDEYVDEDNIKALLTYYSN